MASQCRGPPSPRSRCVGMGTDGVADSDRPRLPRMPTYPTGSTACVAEHGAVLVSVRDTIVQVSAGGDTEDIGDFQRTFFTIEVKYPLLTGPED